METDGGGSVFRERKRTAVRTAVVMAVAAATMVLCAALYMRSVTGTLREETLSGLREVARQSAGNIAMRIEKDMQMLEAVSRFVGAQPELDIDGVTRVLCEEVESTSFKRMGLITPDGTAHTTDSVEMDLGGRGYFLRAMDGETVISKELTDYADGEPIYVYATPILRGMEGGGGALRHQRGRRLRVGHQRADVRGGGLLLSHQRRGRRAGLSGQPRERAGDVQHL